MNTSDKLDKQEGDVLHQTFTILDGGWLINKKGTYANLPWVPFLFQEIIHGKTQVPFSF